MKLYVGIPSDDLRHNLSVAYWIHLLKNGFRGTYFNGHELYPVLKLPNDVHVPEQLFKQISENEFKGYFKAICTCCGACCQFNPGGFIFEDEAAKQKILEILLSHRVDVRVVDIIGLNRRVKVYSMPRRSDGSCIFYDKQSRRCTLHPCKPAICLITTCAVVLERDGQLYIRTQRGVEPTSLDLRDLSGIAWRSAREWLKLEDMQL